MNQNLEGQPHKKILVIDEPASLPFSFNDLKEAEFISSIDHDPRMTYLMNSTIITDKHFLNMRSRQASDVQEVKKILTCLEKVLDKQKDGLGLCAIQIGIPVRVALIKYGGLRIELINSTITEKLDEFIHEGEGCLSFPNKSFDVKRYYQITIENHIIDGDSLRPKTEIYYHEPTELNGVSAKINIAVQHEIDHMDGITLKDSTIQEKVILQQKIGRNDPCICGSGKKYKKCCLLKKGA